MHCALLLLAAGASSRWGRPKALLPWGNVSTLGAHLVGVALASGCTPVVRVLGAYAAEIGREAAPFGLVNVFNPTWAEGMGNSIACGLRTALVLEPALGAVLVLPCDQPLVTPALLGELRTLLLAAPDRLAGCDYGNGIQGPPAGFGRAYFPELLALTGDEGGRHLLRRHAERRIAVSFPDARWDLDSAEDLARFRARAETSAAAEASIVFQP